MPQFIDYYDLLDVSFDATCDEIRKSFKDQALKWHPDRNLGNDTTNRMQQINEAYLILKDRDARVRYDFEYQRYKKQFFAQQGTLNSSTKNTHSGNFSNPDFEIQDEVLKKWINNARNQSIVLAKEAIEDIKEMSFLGIRAALVEAWFVFRIQLVLGIIGLLLLLIFL